MRLSITQQSIMAFGAALIVIGLLMGDAEANDTRKASTVRAFKHEQPCPATHKSSGACLGWVVDHVMPLACGGADATSNMQWQLYIASKAKDLWEIRGDVAHVPCSGLPK
jgi:hypothetical protein